METETKDKKNTSAAMGRLTLRPLEPEDLEMLYLLENDMDLWSVGYTNVPYSRHALRQYIEQGSFDIYRDRQMRLLAVNETGDVVGIVDLFGYEPQHNRAELGLVIFRQYRGMGYGEEIVRLMMDYGRRVVHLHQIYAVVSVDNLASLCMFAKMGFRSNQLMKDWLYDGEKYTDAVFIQLFLKKNEEKFGGSEK